MLSSLLFMTGHSILGRKSRTKMHPDALVLGRCAFTRFTGVASRQAVTVHEGRGIGSEEAFRSRFPARSVRENHENELTFASGIAAHEMLNMTIDGIFSVKD
jgi:hypothetical protein